MEITNYITGKLVPDMLRQKIIDIPGTDETEFINIDSVDVKELNEAFALTKPFAVDVQLSRYCERDVKHHFRLVVKVSWSSDCFRENRSSINHLQVAECWCVCVCVWERVEGFDSRHS